MREDDERTAAQVQRLLLSEHGISACKGLVLKVRRALGWQWQRAKFSPMTREVNKQKRVTHAKLWLETGENFHHMLFTDESTISLVRFNTMAFRKKKDTCLLSRSQNNPVKIHVWGGISKFGPGPLVLFEGIMDAAFFKEHIVTNALVPYLKQVYPDRCCVMMDNDPKHSCAAPFMASNGVNWLRTPPESPDMNPVEMVWAHLKGYLKRVHKPTNKAELIDGILKFWRDFLTIKICCDTIDHIKKVLPVVIERNGAATNM
ncbi:hypothetical protein AB205_0078930 [Aquarana catesbeiana]|uniref:Tc1-like transposase DDE domain-containing protein n=1 Tax=Aquarana catesbeiana TaxID=8400 RepID=A0A2G9QHQ0_AQUCT|nr:hypothetical protein AB205_0078930 [Aquarana catesbeiana]